MARKKKDGRYLAELKQSCANKAAEWEQRQKDAAGEMAAIAKAKEILAEGVKVFLQVWRRLQSHVSCLQLGCS